MIVALTPKPIKSKSDPIKTSVQFEHIDVIILKEEPENME